MNKLISIPKTHRRLVRSPKFYGAENAPVGLLNFNQPEPKQKLNGAWIAPNGRMYRCMDKDHVRKASELVARYKIYDPDNNPELALERAGYVKIADNVIAFSGRKIKYTQKNAIYDYMLDMGYETLHHAYMYTQITARDLFNSQEM